MSAMARFAYSALASSGEIVSGEIEGPDAAFVIRRLHDQALIPIEALERKATEPRWWQVRPNSTRGLGGQELARFSHQLARLLAANVPLERALEILAELAGSARGRSAVLVVLERLRDGASLSEAMGRAKGAFPASYVSMVRAGEASGALAIVLARLGEFLTRAEAMRQAVISALIYPAILLVVAWVAIGIVLTAVLPQFEPLFREAGAKLPTSTRIVMAAGDIVREGWWMALLGFVLGALGWQRLMARPRWALIRDQLWLRTPVVGTLQSKLNIARFCRTLGVLLRNGVAAPQALALGGAVIANRAISGAVERVALAFKEGAGFSAPLAASGYFPPLVTRLIGMGEETGKLEDMLGEIAEIYEEDVQRSLDRLLALLVPVITITMGLVVAFILAAVLTAMISINELAVT